MARELGISDTLIQKFRKELTERGPEAFPGSGQEEEISRLKRELEIVKQAWNVTLDYIETFYESNSKAFHSPVLGIPSCTNK